jgi:ribosomal protein S11
MEQRFYIRRNYSELLTTFGGSQAFFVLRAWQPAAAMPAAQKDASRRRRRGIKHLKSYAKGSSQVEQANPL